MNLQYIVMENELGINRRWIVTEEFENMYEVVCERDKSRITYVGKDKVEGFNPFGGLGNSCLIHFGSLGTTGYCDRMIDMSNRNGSFAFTSLGLIVALDC